MSIEQNITAAFKFVNKVIDNPDAYPDHIVLLPFDPKLLASIFTEERLRIWREVRRRPAQSITQLANRLGRDVSRVRQDLLLLERVHLLEMKRRGRRIEPVANGQHIIIAGP